MATAADLSIKGHEVSLIKTSTRESEAFERLKANGNRIFLKENGEYVKAAIRDVSMNLGKVADAEVIFITLQSTYHEELISKLTRYLRGGQILVIFCSYGSSFYVRRLCPEVPPVAETTGPYLEGRTELDDMPGEVVFRVGCRLTRCPLSLCQEEGSRAMTVIKLCRLYNGFSLEYDVLECALLNPNMVLHTVGSIMSIPRIEYTGGNFCMYREAYARSNKATLNIMLALDKEKMSVLKKLGYPETDIFQSGGFLGDRMESFYAYSESKDRAISPTSVRSRYITEDVSQGLVLLESIANLCGIQTPIASALIDIADAALDEDFRKNGRTAARLGLGMVAQTVHSRK